MKTRIFRKRRREHLRAWFRRFRFSDRTKKYYRRGILAAALLVLCLVVANALRVEPALMNSAEVLSLEERGVLKVGIRTDIPGMSQDGEGLEIALAESLASRFFPDAEAGSALELVELTSMSVAAKLSDGSIDVAIAMMPLNAAPTTYAYSQAYYSDACRFVVRQNGWLTLTDGIVGCIQDSPCETLLDSFMEAHPEYNITKLLFSAYPDMLTALEGERINAAVLTDLYIRKYQQLGRAFQATDTSLGAIQYAVACPIDSSAFARIADLMLSDMRESGRLSVLYSQYGLSQD